MSASDQGPAQTITPASAVNGAGTSTVPITMPMGTSTGTYIPGGVLSVNTTPARNVSTGETDLMTYSLPANALSVNGKGVRITAVFTTAANGNQHTPKMYFGGTAISTQGTTTSAMSMKIVAEVLRVTATTQIAAALWSGTNTSLVLVTSPAETLSGAVVIKVTGASSVQSNDITCVSMVVEALP